MRENLVNDSSILCVWYSLSLVIVLLNAHSSSVRHLLLWENTDPKQFLEEKVYLVYKLQSIIGEAKAGTQDRNVEGGAETKPWMGAGYWLVSHDRLSLYFVYQPGLPGSSTVLSGVSPPASAINQNTPQIWPQAIWQRHFPTESLLSDHSDLYHEDKTNKQNDQRSSVCSNQLHLYHGFTKIILQVHLWIFMWTLYSPKPMVEHRYVCVMDWKWCSGRLKTLYAAS